MNFTNQQAIVKIKTQKCVRIQYKFASAGCHSRKLLGVELLRNIRRVKICMHTVFGTSHKVQNMLHLIRYRTRYIP